ncbi:glycosyltransferase family 17 protein [Atractiella rhizophila]|nr:glycosyltransferase family 17 protein [Atractiella rhizophila]KAH8919006.1 glycosyltransferase family 17 protein [Atractiella rhizophila]
MRRRLFALLLVLTLCLIAVLLPNPYSILHRIHNTLSYVTRPLWDSSPAPSQPIHHFYAQPAEVGTAEWCALHGWKMRDKEAMVVDATLISSEVELMQVRMRELEDVVDVWVVVESNGTFTGKEKGTPFRDALMAGGEGKFGRWRNRIQYEFLPGQLLEPGYDPFDIEIAHRRTMTRTIRQYLSSHADEGATVLVLMSDVDEIPYAHTLSLLRKCDFGPTIHLSLCQFLYSFEFPLPPTVNSWRASVNVFEDNTYYGHGKRTELVLEDSGWHCSFCFRTIEEVRQKMTGYSHADRVGGRQDLLTDEWIRESLCKGRDVFDMLPEAYTWSDLWGQMDMRPWRGAVNVPRLLIEDPERFKFLLPGGCNRP